MMVVSTNESEAAIKGNIHLENSFVLTGEKCLIFRRACGSCSVTRRFCNCLISVFQIEGESPLPPTTPLSAISHVQIWTDIGVRFGIPLIYGYCICSMQDVRRDTSSRDSDRRADRTHRRAICVRQLRTAMVFGMCEGATDGCRRLIESCQLGRGSAW